MRNIVTIAAKEVRSYFVSPVAYVVMAIFSVVSGFFTFTAVSYFLSASIQAGDRPMDVTEWVVRPVLMNVGVLSLFLIPMITMRLFAEEKRTGTIELLITSPLRDVEIAVGKWLGAMVMYGCILAVSVVNLSVLFYFGSPDWRPMVTGYLGLLMQGGALLALGGFLSNTTKNQIVAGAMTFGLALLLWVLDWVSGLRTDAAAKVMAYISLTPHMSSFAKGVLDSRDVVYFLSVIVLGLFLTVRSLESLRWRA